jgi:hypothetical protein
MELMTTSIPDLKLTHDLYERAADGVRTHLPSLPALTREGFADLSSWACIPDDQGLLSKAEKILVRTPTLTAKINIWFRADLRGGNKPLPHNHPWTRFTGYLLGAGYDEDRYEVEGQDVTATLGLRHVSPAANTLDHATYHEVSAVHEPGKTLSLMVCSAWRRGDWGHLDVDTGRHIPLEADPDFDAKFAALNRHRG